MPPQQLIVHSYVFNGNVLLHNIRCDNIARLKHIRCLLLHLGYEARKDVGTTRTIHTVATPRGDIHTINFWSLDDRPYHTVPQRTHNAILKALKLRVNNNLHVTPTFLSTHAEVRHSRTSRRSPSSPVPLHIGTETRR